MSKKVYAWLLVLVLLIGSTAIGETVIYAYVRGNAPLRVLPGDTRPIITNVDNGAQVKIIYEGSTWHKVLVVNSNKTGWMASADLTISNRGQSATDYGSVMERKGIINSNVSLRWGPETYYDVITDLYYGTRCWIYEYNESWTWCRIRLQDGRVGYIPANSVSTTSETIDFGDNAYGFVQVSGGYAGFLKDPSGATGQWNALATGTVVKILDQEEKDRYHVKTENGKEGYVYYNLISVGGMAATRGSLELRYDKSFTADVIRMTPAYQTVKVLATDGTYSRIEYDTHIGYVMNGDLTTFSAYIPS